jgi:hypothetical protein
VNCAVLLVQLSAHVATGVYGLRYRRARRATLVLGLEAVSIIIARRWRPPYTLPQCWSMTVRTKHFQPLPHSTKLDRMAVYQRTYRDKNTGDLVTCETFMYDYIFHGQRYKGSTECTTKTRAKAFEKDMRERLERAWSGLPTEKPAARVRMVAVALNEYEEHYGVDHARKSVAL